MQKAQLTLSIALLTVLVGCNTEPGKPAQPEPSAPETATPETGAGETSPDAAETVSILRPDVEAELETTPEASLENFTITIGFPDAGSDLDGEAIAALEQVIASEQIAKGLPITLGAHSDAAGSDQANEKAAEARGLAVAQWLIEQGVDPERINLVVFGEQNPVEPNAMPDGSPNEAGRAANRRVEITVPAMSLTVSATDAAEEQEPK